MAGRGGGDTGRGDPLKSASSTMSLPTISSSALHLQLLEEGIERKRAARQRARDKKLAVESEMREKKERRVEEQKRKMKENRAEESLKADKDLQWASEGLDLYLSQNIGLPKDRGERTRMIKEGVGEMSKMKVGKPEQLWASSQDRMNSTLRDLKTPPDQAARITAPDKGGSHFSSEKYLKQLMLEKKIKSNLEGIGTVGLPKIVEAGRTGAQTTRRAAPPAKPPGMPGATASSSNPMHMLSPRVKRIPDPRAPWRTIDVGLPAYLRLSNPLDAWRRPVLSDQVEQRIALIANDDIAVRQHIAKTLDFTVHLPASQLRKSLGIVTRLIYASLGGAEKDMLVQAVSRLIELREEGTGAFIKDGDVEDVAKVMWIHPGLEHLNLSGNLVKERGCRVLSEAIAASQVLRTVDLSGNPIGVRGARAVADAVRNSPSITYLSLKLCETRDEGATAIADALLVNRKIATLELSSNAIGDNGAVALANALKKAGGNRTLEKLDLSHNLIHTQGAHAITGVMKINRKLTWLDLFDNNITDAAAVHLAQMVVQYQTLRVFSSLDMNDLKHDRRVSMHARCGPAGAHIIAHYLATSKKLKKLDFRDNKLDDKSVRGLMEALSENKSLESLDIRGNDDQYVIPREVVDSGGNKVVEIMRDAMESGSNQLLRMKWMLLGRGEAGKSSLFNTLRSGTTMLQSREARTVGTDIEQFKPSEESPVSVSVWDCGGQGVYWRVGNTMYLTEQRTLYLVVFDLSCTPPISGLQEKNQLFSQWTEENEMQWIRFWIRLLLLHAPRCVITLVGTKADLCDVSTRARRMERAKAVLLDTVSQQRKSLQRRMAATQIKLATVKRQGGDEKAEEHLYGVMEKLKRLLMFQPQLAGEVQAVSCKDLKSIEAVRGHLIKSMDDLMLFPDLKNIIPRTWSDLLHGVEEMVLKEDTPPSMSWYDFRELMMTKFFNNNDEAEASFNKAVSFLHSTGTILHLGTPGTSDEIVVLRPQWLVDVIKQVIRHDFSNVTSIFPAVKHLVSHLIKKGELHNMLLRVLWSSRVLGHSVDPALHEHLVRVMCQFEVLMPFSDEAYLVPCFFPEHPGSEFQWSLWPPSQGPRELVLGWSVTIHPSPSGLFENTLGTSTRDLKLMPGAYRRDVRGSLADGVEAGALLMSRRNNTRLLLRVDPRTVLVVARMQCGDDESRVEDEKVALAVELNTFLNQFKGMCEMKYPGVCEVSTALLCPSCLSRQEVLSPQRTCADFLNDVGNWEDQDMVMDMEELRKSGKGGKGREQKGGRGGAGGGMGGGGMGGGGAKKEALTYEQFLAHRSKRAQKSSQSLIAADGAAPRRTSVTGGGRDDEDDVEAITCRLCGFELPVRHFRPFEIVAGAVDIPQDVDVYLSYRPLHPGDEIGSWVTSVDRVIASVLFERMGEKLVNTFWDVRCVGPQDSLMERVIESIMQAPVFMPIISKNTVGNLEAMRKDAEEVDSILLEYVIALELLDMGIMASIVPIINGMNPRFDGLPDFVPEKTIHKAWKSIEAYVIPRGIRQSVPYPQRRTIRQIFKQVLSWAKEPENQESYLRFLNVDMKSLIASEVKLSTVVSAIESIKAVDQVSEVVKLVHAHREAHRKEEMGTGDLTGETPRASDERGGPDLFAQAGRGKSLRRRNEEEEERDDHDDHAEDDDEMPTVLPTGVWQDEVGAEVVLGCAVELLMLGDKAVAYKEHLAAGVLLKCSEWPGPGQTVGRWKASTERLATKRDYEHKTSYAKAHEGVVVKTESAGKGRDWALGLVTWELQKGKGKVTLMVQVGETAVVVAVRCPKSLWGEGEEVAGIGLRMAMEETQRYISRHVPQMLTARRVLCPHCLMAPASMRLAIPMAYSDDISMNMGVWEVGEFSDALQVHHQLSCNYCKKDIREAESFKKLTASIDELIVTSSQNVDVYVSTYGAFFLRANGYLVQTMLDELDKASLQVFYEPPGDAKLMLKSKLVAPRGDAEVAMRDKARDSVKNAGKFTETIQAMERTSMFVPCINQAVLVYMGESARRAEVDHVLLELVLAVELQKAGRLQVIMPLFTDGKVPRPGVESGERLPGSVVKAANAALTGYGLKATVTTKTTVRHILDKVMGLDSAMLPPAPSVEEQEAGGPGAKGFQNNVTQICAELREIRQAQKSGAIGGGVAGVGAGPGQSGSCMLVTSRQHISIKRKLLCDLLHRELADKGITTFQMPPEPSTPESHEEWIMDLGKALGAAQVYMPIMADSTVQAVVQWVKGDYTKTIFYPMVEYVASLELLRRGKLQAILPMIVDHPKSQKQLLKLPKELLDIEFGSNIMDAAGKAVEAALLVHGTADDEPLHPRMTRRTILDLIELHPYILPTVEDGRGKQFRSALQGAVAAVSGKLHANRGGGGPGTPGRGLRGPSTVGEGASRFAGSSTIVRRNDGSSPSRPKLT